MRSLIFALALLPLPAMAAQMPVRGEYCFDALDLSPAGLGYGPDTWCTADAPASPDGKVAMTCEDESGNNPPFALDATIVEDAAAKTVRYQDKNGAVTLPPCE